MCIRDSIDGVRETGLPVWCQGTAAPASVAGLTFVAWQQAIGCGGVAVVSVSFKQLPGPETGPKFVLRPLA